MTDSYKRQQIVEADRKFREDTLRLYRRYLEGYVIQASPLLLDLIELWRVDLLEGLRRMRPLPGWPFRIPKMCKSRTVMEQRVGLWFAPKRSRPSPIMFGADGRQNLRLILADDTLETRVHFGEVMCQSRSGTLHVWLPGYFAETLMASVIGRPLAEVVDHAAFRLRTYRVHSALRIGDRTLIQADAPDVEYTIPTNSL